MRRKEFADAIGTNADHVSQVEFGHRALRVSVALAWATALGCEPTLLVRAALQDQMDAAGVAMRVEIKETA